MCNWEKRRRAGAHWGTKLYIETTLEVRFRVLRQSLQYQILQPRKGTQKVIVGFLSVLLRFSMQGPKFLAEIRVPSKKPIAEKEVAELQEEKAESEENVIVAVKQEFTCDCFSP
ncbi:hypothetical protein AQUCO_01800012v1 [Aquilegia coerulea]|uniref:Uncharacterized protein n=1 Tax=Aquilegia coerulea TaxID=218851 RepID=A0A2G5DJF7_AQUCA|nr:hypothetical protein AQUCO_01800012v1 [Aquilegia coerulea]